MELTFIEEPIPELTFTGNILAHNGFTPGTWIAIQYQYPVLCVSVIRDQATWDTVCETSQYNSTVGADWVRDDGHLVIGGDWLTDIDITQAEHVDIAITPGIIIIRRRMEGILRA